MPHLKHLTVRGFKSIRALEDFDLRELNVLIGANGAGKSNLILDLVRHECAHFGQWLKRIESLPPLGSAE